MLKRFGLRYVAFLILCDLALTDIALYLARHVRVLLELGVDVGPEGKWLHFDPIHYLLGPAIWLVVSSLTSVYDSRRTLRAVDEFQAVAWTMLLSVPVLTGIEYLFFRDFSRLLLFYFFGLDLCLLVAWRVLLRLAFRSLGIRWPREKRRVLIVGAGKVGQQLAEMVKDHAWTGLELLGFLDDDLTKRTRGLPVLGTLNRTRQIVQSREVDEVVIALPLRAHERLNQLVATLHELPVRVRVVPDYFSLALYRAVAEDFAGVPMIDLRAPALDDYQRVAKRLFDLAVGGFLTVLALPVVGLVALAIKLDSPGPVLFRQRRVGENGRLFLMFKFRSMVCGAEGIQSEINEANEAGEVVHKKPDDPRVTRVGRFIRSTSLDELPQLFNVLKGEMSLVGPRPEMPWLVDEYEPWQRTRFAVPQGITGWWQVNGRSDKLMHMHTEEDLYYVQNYSLLLDVQILWKTIWVVLRRRGAY